MAKKKPEMTKESILNLLKEGSPHGKLQSPLVAFKAYAASMILGLVALGFTRDDVEEMMKHLSHYGLPKATIDGMINLAFAPKNPSQDQTSDSLSE